MFKIIIEFMQDNPKFFKRVLITSNKTVVWSSLPPITIIKYWKRFTSKPLRIMPNFPLEGGATQIQWNNLWDKATPIIKGVRILK